MWITQTYLGVVEPDATLFIYYCFMDYIREQKEFTEKVQEELERLGDAFGDQISLLMPNPKYADCIEAELRDALWRVIYGNLPGLFLSCKPLGELQPTDDDCVYIPFNTTNPEDVAAVILRVRNIADDTLNRDYARQSQLQKESFGTRLYDAIEFKPGIWGFSIDLKRLGRH